MTKLPAILGTLAFGLAACAHGPAATDPNGPEATVLALFDAMRAADGDRVRELVAEGAPLDRVRADGTVQAASFEGWAASIDTLEPGQVDEQVFDLRVDRFGGLASVWAPFVLTVRGTVQGCGVNHFTLAETPDGWQVIHGVDTQDGGDCTTFRSRYANGL